jgi:hypothetical protein
MYAMTGFELSRNWFDWAFENPEKINPNHAALYFFIVEHCNRLGWKEKFGLPTTMAKDAIGIRSYNTYIKTLNDLVDFGFVLLIEKSKNQYSSNIVALSKKAKAHDKALDKALIKHTSKQHESTRQSISSIDKQVNQLNQETIEQSEILLLIHSELPKVKNMAKPLTLAEAKRIEDEFDMEAVKSVLQAMENYAELKKYESTNLTLRNWIKKVPDHKKVWISENGLRGEYVLTNNGKVREYKEGRFDEWFSEGRWKISNKFNP